MRVPPTKRRPTPPLTIVFLCLAPWTLLIAERIIDLGYKLEMDGGLDDISLPVPANIGIIPLPELTRSNLVPSCPVNQTAVLDSPLPMSAVTNANRKIPKIVHQTSMSRCLMHNFTNCTDQWHLDGWAYYFHDDDAVDRLFAKDWPEFPHLQEVSQCILYGAVKADLWRYLVLYEYGGLYSDIDAIPNLFNISTIQDEDDGFFVVEHSNLLSQYFLAMSPRHPLMYYAIQVSLSNILREPDIGYINTPLATGPQALHEAFQNFMLDAGTKIPHYYHYKVTSGFYMGTGNRTILVVGRGDYQDEYVIRENIDRRPKKRMYKEMGMAYFMDRERNGRSCYSVMLEARKNMTIL